MTVQWGDIQTLKPEQYSVIIALWWHMSYLVQKECGRSIPPGATWEGFTKKLDFELKCEGCGVFWGVGGRQVVGGCSR